MTTVRQRFADRFAHPRLAALALGGLAVLAVGALLWLGTPTGSQLQRQGFQLFVLGYLAALAGGAGYLSFAAFRYRDRQLR